MFGFASSDIRLRNRSYFTNTVRTFEGQDLGSIVGVDEYLRTEGSNPFFDVKSVQTDTIISCQATCRDSFYGFEGNKFSGEFKKIEINIHSGSPSRAVFHPIIDVEGEEPLLHISVVLEDSQFGTLFRHLWISPTPATIRIAISVPCFQYPSAGMALGYPEDAVLEAKVLTAQLDDVSVEKRLITATKDDGQTEDEDLSASSSSEIEPDLHLNASRDIKKHAVQIAQSVKRIELIVGVVAAIYVVAKLFNL